MSLSPDIVKSIGFWILVSGLLGDILVLFMPASRRKLEKTLGVIFTLVIIAGVGVEQIGDKLASSTLAKIECDQSQMLERHFSARQRLALVNNLKPFRGLVANLWTFSGGRLEKMNFAIVLSSVFREAGWKNNGVSMRMMPIPVPAYTGFVAIMQREGNDPRVNAAAKTLAETLNGDCIKVELIPTPFTKETNGAFGQTIVLDKNGQHLVHKNNIFGPKPLPNADISILVGDAL